MENVSEWNDIKSLRKIDEPIAGLIGEEQKIGGKTCIY